MTETVSDFVYAINLVRSVIKMTHVSPQLPPRDAPNEKMVIDLYEQIDVLPPVRPMSGSVRTVIPIEMAQKLDSILMTVQNIDKGVKILSQPPRPPKSFQAPKPEVRNCEFLEISQLLFRFHQNNIRVLILIVCIARPALIAFAASADASLSTQLLPTQDYARILFA